jgi:hypothetical protein
VDRQRRAPPLIALSQSYAAFRRRAVSRAVLVSLSVAFLALSAGGCRNKKEEARQKAELTASLDQFKGQVAELQKQAAGLRVRFDNLPEGLVGTEGVRDNLHAVEEGLGVEGGRAQWLSGELDKAFASGKKQEIEAVRNAIPRGNDGMAQMVIKVAHELIPFERAAAQRRFFEKLDAENAAKQAEAQKDVRPDARKRPPKAR